jgi:hypothetical protein
MFRITRRGFVSGLAGTIAGSALWTSVVSAQELTRGFSQTARSHASGEELNRQRNIWAMQVDFKPMRMIFVDHTDPATGQSRTDRIMYLAYRAINRPMPGRGSDADVRPVNEPEPMPGPEKFIPEFSLVTYDDRGTEIPDKTYSDVILPEAVRRVNRIELRGSEEPRFLDSVSIIQDLPAPVELTAPDQPYLYGVATWKNVDADADFFKVIMQGFSNGYYLEAGPDGKPVTYRRVLVQKFIRRGDRFDPNQMEFLFDGNPTWEYQPSETSLELPGIEAPAQAPAGDAPAAEAPAAEEAAPADEPAAAEEAPGKAPAP